MRRGRRSRIRTSTRRWRRRRRARSSASRPGPRSDGTDADPSQQSLSPKEARMWKSIVSLVALCGLLATPSRAEDAKWVKLIHADTGKVLAVADNSDDAGAHAVLAKDD